MTDVTKEDIIKALKSIQDRINGSLDKNIPIDPSIKNISNEIYVWYEGWKAGYARGKQDGVNGDGNEH